MISYLFLSGLAGKYCWEGTVLFAKGVTHRAKAMKMPKHIFQERGQSGQMY